MKRIIKCGTAFLLALVLCLCLLPILLDFFSEDDPYTLSEYTQKIGGI